MSCEQPHIVVCFSAMGCTVMTCIRVLNTAQQSDRQTDIEQSVHSLRCGQRPNTATDSLHPSNCAQTLKQNKQSHRFASLGSHRSVSSPSKLPSHAMAAPLRVVVLGRRGSTAQLVALQRHRQQPPHRPATQHVSFTRQQNNERQRGTLNSREGQYSAVECCAVLL